MLNLSGLFKYFLCTEPVTLRYRHRGLREYIRRSLHRDPMNGDVYIFLSRNFTRLRVYYFHHRGEILTEKILHNNRYVTPVFEDAEKNVYCIGMLKSEEHIVEVITSDLHEEKRRRHAAEQGKREAERRVNMLEKKVDVLQSQLTAKIDEISSLLQQMVQFMMGNGAVSLSESVKDSVIAGVRAEYERRETEMRQSYEVEIAALRNEINALKNKDGQNPSSGSPSSEGGPSIETRLKSAEQQRANLAVTAYGQHTES